MVAARHLHLPAAAMSKTSEPLNNTCGMWCGGIMNITVPTNILNPLTPNDPYRGRTAPLTSKVVFYIFIQQI